jgi:diaminohydroxyphosphoribosylaminopyrimidine deaminase/5-amino-6-(5-phosphoribosylamino)uracil reductase
MVELRKCRRFSCDPYSQGCNPLLTCRLHHNNPIRIIVDPRLETSLNSHVVSCPPETIIVTRASHANGPAEKTLRAKGILFVEYESERLDLAWLMKELGKRHITSVLVEGGSSLSSSCLEAGVVDKVIFFIAPKIIGGRDSFPAIGGKSFRRLAEAHRIRDIKTRRIGKISYRRVFTK